MQVIGLFELLIIQDREQIFLKIQIMKRQSMICPRRGNLGSDARYTTPYFEVYRNLKSILAKCPSDPKVLGTIYHTR